MNKSMSSSAVAALTISIDQQARPQRFLWTALMSIQLVLSSLLIAGCGGSNSSSVPVAEPPVASSGIATVGPISAFGSVYANGVVYDTSSAMVSVDGMPANLSDLQVGMVVSIRGDVNNATRAAAAREIIFSDDAEGVITSIDEDNNSIVVLGRMFMFDELTMIENATFDSLAVGNVVRVSGQLRSQKRIQATHIERKSFAYAPGMEIGVKGEVEGLDVAAQHFKLGTQECDYSSARQELGGAELANGLYVEVSSRSPLSNGTLLLDRVATRERERERQRLCDSGCDFELAGYVTLFVSPAEFDVDGSPVSATDNTMYVNGTVDDLKLDAKLAVDGEFDTDGILIAQRIVFRLPLSIAIEADVESINLSNATVTALGTTIVTNDSTMFRDKSVADLREFGLDDLAIGDRIEVRAYLDGGMVVAALVERDDSDDDVMLRGPIDAIDRPTLTVLGVMVISDPSTIYQNEAKELVDADRFFSLVSTGEVVLAEGTYDGTSILASKLFLRDCEENCM